MALQVWAALLGLGLLGRVTGDVLDDLCVLHFADAHGRLEAVDGWFGTCSEGPGCSGGFARLATAVAEEKSKCKCSVVLDGGDHFLGTLWTKVYYGSAQAKFLPALQVDAVLLGQHEFDYGPQVASLYAKDVLAGGIPLVLSNIDSLSDPYMRGLLSPWAVVGDGCGREIGVVGWQDNKTYIQSAPGPNVRFKDPVEALTDAVADLKAAHPGVASIIALSYAGLGKDVEVGSRLPADIDLLVGGDSHSFLYNQDEGPVPEYEEGGADSPEDTYPVWVARPPPAAPLPIVHAFWATRYLGRVVLSFADNGGAVTVAGATGNPILLGGEGSGNPVAPDAAVAAQIENMRSPLELFERRVVATSCAVLPSALLGPEGVRQEENRLGNLIADAFVWGVSRYMPNLDLPTEVAMVNGGDIRADLPEGEVTAGNVIDTLPFGNSLVVKAMPGTAVVEALAFSATLAGLPNELGSGGFLQVSGLQYTFDEARNLSSVLIRANGTMGPVDPAGVYNVAMPDWIARGGDGFTMIAASPLSSPAGGPTVDGILVEYLLHERVVCPELEGRVMVPVLALPPPGSPPPPTTNGGGHARGGGVGVAQLLSVGAAALAGLALAVGT